MKTLTRTSLWVALSLPLFAGSARADGAAEDPARRVALTERRACVGEAATACYAQRGPSERRAPVACIAAGVDRCELRYHDARALQALLKP
jgi:hypothetical protein